MKNIIQENNETQAPVVHLGYRAISLAETFSSQFDHPTKQESVKRNILYVLGVQRYIESRGIETSFEESNTSNILMHIIDSPSDLVVSRIGRILVCPFRENNLECSMNEDEYKKYLLCVAAHLSEDKKSIELFGFTPNLTEISSQSVDSLREIHDLANYLIDRMNVPDPQSKLISLESRQVIPRAPSTWPLRNEGEVVAASSSKFSVFEKSKAIDISEYDDQILLTVLARATGVNKFSITVIFSGISRDTGNPTNLPVDLKVSIDRDGIGAKHEEIILFETPSEEFDPFEFQEGEDFAISVTYKSANMTIRLSDF